MAAEILHIKAGQAGRVVLPKGIRDRMGIREGTEFEVEERENVILLKPVHQETNLVEKNGLLVVQSKRPLTVDLVRETIEKVREERNRAILGL